MELPELSFDAPIAGQSLTSEVGNRPWQQPPQFATAEQAVEHYLPKLLDPKLAPQLLDVIEMGIPITTIANALQIGGVMQGLHTIDVGILVLPVLIEVMINMAETEGIKYTTGTEEQDDALPTEGNMALAMQNVKKKMGEAPEPPMPAEPAVEEQPPMGLMSRGVQ
jgi:hypothetical protein